MCDSMGGNKMKPLKLKQKTAQQEIKEQNEYLDAQMTEEWTTNDGKDNISSFATASLSILLAGGSVFLVAFGTNKCMSWALGETTLKTQKNLLHTVRDTPAPYILTKQDSIDAQNSLHFDSLAQEEGDSLIVKPLVK